MRFFKLNFLFAALLLSGMMSCGDDEKGIEEINIADGNAVSETLKFKNVTATSKDGELPASSTDPDAPVLIDEENQITSISGTDFLLEIFEETGSELKGMYLQVDGSDDYFDVSLESVSSGGRLAGKPRKNIFGGSSRVKQIVDQILISLPENMAKGTFCLTFAVYDVEGRISNYLNVCVEVLKAGGENSNFLTANDWEMVYVYYKEVYSDIVYEGLDSVGVSSKDTIGHTIYCDDQTMKNIEEIYEWKMDYAYVTFSSNGTISVDQKSFEKYLDFDKTTCDNLVYEEISETYQQEGSWSYDDNKKEITLVFTYTFDFGDEEISEMDVTKYKVEKQSNGDIKIIYEETDSEGSYKEIIYFKIKK